MEDVAAHQAGGGEVGRLVRGALAEHAVRDVLRGAGVVVQRRGLGVDEFEPLVGVGPGGEEEGVRGGVAQRVSETLRA